jgi:hypothetical protein
LIARCGQIFVIARKTQEPSLDQRIRLGGKFAENARSVPVKPVVHAEWSLEKQGYLPIFSDRPQ